jgi:hypothetical protein
LEHLQNAVYLEMWTVPLYLTSAYSLDVPSNPSTNRPEFAAVPVKDGKPDFASFTQQDYNQYAFNNILSVAIQEMLHVELASNLLNAVREAGSPVTFTGAPQTPPLSAPSYAAPPACLAADALPPGVTLKLGRFDENQALLFQWVETPKPKPAYDIDAWRATYDSIGHFYESLSYGVLVCWADLYPAAGRAADPFQRDDWEAAARRARGGRLLKAVFDLPAFHVSEARRAAKGSGGAANQGGAADPADSPELLQASYKDFSIKIYGTREEALVRARAAMTAITVQGEGAGPDTKDIPTKFQPTGDPEDAIEIALDKVTHYERFTELVGLAQEGKFSYVPVAAAPTPGPFLNALNQSYSAFLSSLNEAFSGNTGAMSIAAMAGLGNRVLQAWENGVAAAEMFQWVDGNEFVDPTGAKGYHACQGLDKTGTSDCAYGFFHTCAGANMCKGQGGCGARNDGENPPIDWQPGSNECKNLGHCGIPIPASQCFDDPAAKPADVWQYARQKMGFPTNEPQPNSLRASLSSTSGVTCPADE